MAQVWATNSHCKRSQVGCLVVKDKTIVSDGYNGTPTGFPNICEDENYKSKPEVLHAETNAIAKLARSNESGLGAAMFVTHAPCLDCAKLIYQSGISKVYYRNTYRESFGIEFLEKSNIDVEQI